jgi:BirA family biotin operon repressor/biotin-[acetyl-CoA-carboxylase] ligase
MDPQRPIEDWPAALEAAVAQGTHIRHLQLLRETASTQDHARAAVPPAGTVVVAFRQTAGRGRLHRAWADTAHEGIALTFVLEDRPPESLAMRSAVAAAAAARALAGDAPGIKWPNDVVADGRKLAGVLVERADGRAFVGIGMNVLQRSFPPELAPHATSLALLGAGCDRLHAVVALIRSVEHSLTAAEDAIYRTYRALDRMCGHRFGFLTPDGPVDGMVLDVDPTKGLLLQTPEGPRFLPAATTSVAPPASGSRYGDGDVAC